MPDFTSFIFMLLLHPLNCGTCHIVKKGSDKTENSGKTRKACRPETGVCGRAPDALKRAFGLQLRASPDEDRSVSRVLIRWREAPTTTDYLRRRLRSRGQLPPAANTPDATPVYVRGSRQQQRLPRGRPSGRESRQPRVSWGNTERTEKAENSETLGRLS